MIGFACRRLSARLRAPSDQPNVRPPARPCVYRQRVYRSRASIWPPWSFVTLIVPSVGQSACRSGGGSAGRGRLVGRLFGSTIGAAMPPPPQKPPPAATADVVPLPDRQTMFHFVPCPNPFIQLAQPTAVLVERRGEL